MQPSKEAITILDTIAGHVVVVRDSMSGWRVIEDGFTADRSYAAIRAAGVEGARLLPAIQERQEVTVPGRKATVRVVVLVDWQALRLSGRKDEPWYAVRIAPGAQRMAAQMQEAPEYRKGETTIERNLREAGIDVYMPAYWREIRAHRGGKLRARRLPLLVGYAFIRHDPGRGFDPVRDVDGVIDIVKVRRTPVTISEEDVSGLMIEMFEQDLKFRLQKAQNVEEARFKRRQVLNAELGRHLPRGRGRTVSLRVYADECIGNLSATARKRVMGIISAIDGLEDDASLDEYRKAV